MAELDAIVGQDGVDLVRNGGNHALQEGCGHCSVRLLMQFGIGELGSAVDSDEQVQLALLHLNFCDVNVEVADRIDPELLLHRLAAFDLRQTADSVPLEAAMQSRAGQVWNARSMPLSYAHLCNICPIACPSLCEYILYQHIVELNK